MRKNETKAIQYLEKSVELGNEEAMFYLGFKYESGKSNLRKNIIKALQLYQKSSEKGHKLGFYF